jgi:hypothetical protein
MMKSSYVLQARSFDSLTLGTVGLLPLVGVHGYWHKRTSKMSNLAPLQTPLLLTKNVPGKISTVHLDFWGVWLKKQAQFFEHGVQLLIYSSSF